MAPLKGLSFTALPKPRENPLVSRRTKLIERLEEQKMLVNDPSFVRRTQRWVKVNGQRQPTEKQQRVSPWWQMSPNGQIVMSVKFGSKPLEFEKGKAGIAVSSKDKLPAVIDTLIAAAAGGELDDLLAQASKVRSSKGKA